MCGCHDAINKIINAWLYHTVCLWYCELAARIQSFSACLHNTANAN
ncbi:hypothetical protein SALWKB12_1162 [Snodgrassella communis]|uniref:Uncharacterized protein n=1 Tax=Snodgrassella communis TaxID=2946699 RepID=A0A837B1D5_9NEIS|nr:hypothetical protein SALWKB12_1162 [Snodgrassella communis]KDN15412.1 hypothetical protein SALWKB29_0516 [Snodgrassella communis]